MKKTRAGFRLVEWVEGGKVRGEGYTAALIFTSYLSQKCWILGKEIVAVIHNIGVVSQNFSRYSSLFAENVAAGAFFCFCIGNTVFTRRHEILQRNV